MSKTTAGIYQDTRRSKRDGTYPVKLRVTFERKNRFYRTGVDLTEKEFSVIRRGTRLGDLWKVKDELDDQVKNAEKIIDELPEFTFSGFRSKFTQEDKTEPQDIFSAIRQYEKELENAGRLNSSDSYHCLYNSLRRFVRKEELQFQEITPKFLSRYHDWMKERGSRRVKKDGSIIERGVSDTTIAIYARNLRRIFNLSVMRGEIPKDIMPFGPIEAGFYRIPVSENPKRALNIEEISKIMEYQPQGGEGYYRDLWIFSYLTNGINMKDMALLKYKDIYKGSVYYERQKTVRLKKKRSKIEAPLLPHSWNIIYRWGNKPEDPGSYIFPILSPGIDTRTEQRLIKQATKMISVHMKRIARKLDISEDISFYSARHSFASVLNDSDVSVNVIKERLGHSNVSVTENYLRTIQSERNREISEKLIPNHGKK